jgi:hypothetical protein
MRRRESVCNRRARLNLQVRRHIPESAAEHRKASRSGVTSDACANGSPGSPSLDPACRRAVLSISPVLDASNPGGATGWANCHTFDLQCPNSFLDRLHPSPVARTTCWRAEPSVAPGRAGYPARAPETAASPGHRVSVVPREPESWRSSLTQTKAATHHAAPPSHVPPAPIARRASTQARSSSARNHSVVSGRNSSASANRPCPASTIASETSSEFSMCRCNAGSRRRRPLFETTGSVSSTSSRACTVNRSTNRPRATASIEVERPGKPT